MCARTAFLLVALTGLSSLVGCANARMVKSERDSGVVALPANTNSWPNYYRDHAEALMRQKFPNGYEVVAEEEEVVGQTAHTHTETETNPSPTLNLGGTKSNAFAGVAVPLGSTEEKTQQTTKYENVTEWRIHFRAKSPTAPPPGVAISSGSAISPGTAISSGRAVWSGQAVPPAAVIPAGAALPAGSTISSGTAIPPSPPLPGS
jgi:hypothetical protein